MILEAILTVIAWRKGWGPIALLPMAFALVVGLIVGATHQPLAMALLGDAVAYVAFFFMIKKGRKVSQPAPAAPANMKPQVEQPAA